MTGRRLILADGTKLEEAEAGYASGNLWCWIPNCSMATAFGLFTNPNRTRKIIFQYGEMQDEYNGFTTCTNVSVDPDGRASVCMTKG